MAQYIDKSALVAEIERRISVLKANESVISMLAGGMFVNEFKDLLSFLDTLEVKGVDLDYIKKELDEAVRIYKPNGNFGWGTLYNVATHFFELGLKAQKGE